MLTCKITLPDSPVIFSKNPGFRARYLARQNEFRFSFNKYFSSFLAAGFCPQNLAFARVSGRGAGEPPKPLARMPMVFMDWMKKGHV